VVWPVELVGVALALPHPKQTAVNGHEQDLLLVPSGLGAAECAICLDPKVNPARFPNPQCPHSYCQQCLDGLLAYHYQVIERRDGRPPHAVVVTRCPQCRRPAPFDAECASGHSNDDHTVDLVAEWHAHRERERTTAGKHKWRISLCGMVWVVVLMYALLSSTLRRPRGRP
jgi:hypothetical protein